MVDYGVILLLCFRYQNTYNAQFMYGILYIKATMFVCMYVCMYVCMSDWQTGAGAGQGRALKRAARAGQGQGLSVCLSDKQGQGRGRAARADTRPLFSVTLAFTDRPSDDRVRLITIFTNCHWKQWFKSSAPPQFHRVSVIVTQERFHPTLALFNCIWFWHWKHHKVPNYVAESFPKCQLHQIMTIS